MILPYDASIMSDAKPLSRHPVTWRRESRGWSQTELARRADLPRTSVSAIEGQRLTPSVTAALALACALECSVEELFRGNRNAPSLDGALWAWKPRSEPCRFWEAAIGGRRLLYPVEGLSCNVAPHDGVWQDGIRRDVRTAVADTTLVLACCDPAIGLLATEYARASGFRLLVFPRGGAAAVDLLHRGLVHLAGMHRSTTAQPARNADSVRAHLGNGFSLLRAAQWQEGVALAADDRTRSLRTVARGQKRWALREPGSGARECLDSLLDDKPAPGRLVHSHAAVAEAVRAGWANAGVCVQLAAEEAGLNFIPVQTEALDFCFTTSLTHDPRVQALIRLLRSRVHRRLVSECPATMRAEPVNW
jgi:molybdate-binding protein/DNA-binding XRE family transcriptional regulator